MDLNLYLGQPSPLPSLGLADFGYDLSLRLLSSPGTVEIGGAAIVMPRFVEPPEPRPPNSPSQTEYSPDLFYLLPSHIINSTEYTPYFPYYERYRLPPLSYLLIPVLQDSGGADAAYSPASIEPLLGAREMIEPSLEDDHSEPYDPTSPQIFPPDAVAYLPTYLTASTSSPVHEAADFSFYPPIPSLVGDVLGGEEGPSLTAETYGCAGAFSERPTESRHRRPFRRFPSFHSQVDERSTFGTLQSPNAEQPRQDSLSTLTSTECNGNRKATAGRTVAEAWEEEDKEKVRNAANFECFICFNMAAEPVVTSCGHLFCWPCLYQWLHVHSDHKECPVCKGNVNDSNITPIYGRGGSPSRPENKTEEDGESALKIPPRPAGNRFESVRQQFWPLSRRLGVGITASLRRLLDAHADGGNRYESYAQPNVQEIFENVHGRALIRLRARRVQREIQAESGPSAADLGVPVANVANPISIDDDFWERLAGSDGNDFWERLAGSDGNDPSTSSLYPNTETPAIWPATDTALTPEASVSSTMAIILGDAANSEVPADHNSVGSSRSYSRSGRSGTSGSLDVDGGTLNSYKRRRLN